MNRNFRLLWRKESCRAIDASPSNEVEDRRIRVGRGGIAICFNLRLQPLTHDKGSLAINRIQEIRLKG